MKCIFRERQKDGRFVYFDASKQPIEHVEDTFLFPQNYTNVCLNANPSDALRGVAVDPKTDKKHYRYAHWHHDRQRTRKYRRMYHMLKQLPEIRKRTDVLLASENRHERVHGLVLRLLDRCGLRPGNRVKYKDSDGLATLTRDNLTVDKNTGDITVRFIGKAQRSNTCSFRDPALVDVIESLGENRLSLSGVPMSFRKHIHPYKLKDFRTLGSNRFFIEQCLASPHPFRKKAATEALAKTAKQLLNNSVKVARLSYIDQNLRKNFVAGTFKDVQPASLEGLSHVENLLLGFYSTYGGADLRGWRDGIVSRGTRNLPERRAFNKILKNRLAA